MIFLLLFGLLAVTVYAVYLIFGSLGKPKKLLKDSSVKHSVKIIDKEVVSHDTILIKFALPTDKHIIGLPVGNCIKVEAQINGEVVQRQYTPVSHVKVSGSFDLLVKVYRANVHPKFPEGGKMTQFLDMSSIGDHLTIHGPYGNLEYLGNGDFRRRNGGPTEKFSKVLMIAGGSGITPMAQILQSSFTDMADSTKFCLVYANKTVEDILMKDILDNYESNLPWRFRLTYTVDELKEEDCSYSGHTGFITADMIKDCCPNTAEDVLVLICGPPPMINYACIPALKSLGVKTKLIYIF